MRSISVFLSALIFAATLLFSQGVMALEPGPITPEEAKAMMQENKDLVIIDLRNPNEYVVVHFATALNIPVNELETRLSEIPEGKPILMHCIKGMRSQRGFDILKEKRPDIKELYFIKGEPIFD